MSNILALDTSSDYCSVALFSNGKLTSSSELAPRSHTQLLLPMAKALIESSDIQLENLDAIAFGCGPGSFTGLRIAAGVAQGLAYGLGCSIFAISNLQAMALQSYRHNGDNNVFVAFDARMDEVYWSAYRVKDEHGHAVIETCGEEHVSSPELVFLPEKMGAQKISAVGSGLSFLERFPESVKQRLSSIDADARPQANAICELALNQVKQGTKGLLSDAIPSYVRDKVTWKKLPGRE